MQNYAKLFLIILDYFFIIYDCLRLTKIPLIIFFLFFFYFTFIYNDGGIFVLYPPALY